MPGRFFLGLGSGENLNEHIVGAKWPSAPVRQAMLAEAIDIIRLLWQGGEQTYSGTYYTADHARLYTLPVSRFRCISPPAARCGRVGRPARVTG